MGAPILYEIPEGSPVVVCRDTRCRALLVWVKTAAGKNMPVNADGEHRAEPHWGFCVGRDAFRRSPT
jgi:hypothetical protein